MGIQYLNDAYAKVVRDDSTPNFFQRAMRALDLSYSVSEEDLARIPLKGPTIVVANHPYGAIDGIVLGALLTRLRSDSKLMANYFLERMEEIKPWLISVDPFESSDSARNNFKAIKSTLRFLKEGGCLGTFPAGTVSHFHFRSRQITDPVWTLNTARLVHMSQATVVPCYFEGNNSLLFQLAGIVHPRLRTILLPREMMRCHGINLRVRIGTPIPYRKLAEFSNNQSLVEFLRLKTYILAKRKEETPAKRFYFPALGRNKDEQVPIIPPLDRNVLSREIAALPEEQRLVQHNQFNVYWAHSGQIPNILQEVGRLREVTFRSVQEGTGEAYDLDRFDLYYRHLFIWDEQTRSIAGAYRLGPTDEILDRHGKDGLYTSTLFKFKPSFLEKLSPALEMGRSFIAPEYQKKHATLSLLWRGIGQFVVLNPRYKILFGPVSISREYHSISQNLIVKFLREHRTDETLRPLVKAKHPPRGRMPLRGYERKALQRSIRTIEDISALVSEIEHDSKGVPALLKHYLKLNGQLISFNVDNDFGHCLDGLIMVDLTRSDRRLLRSYLTPEGLEQFLAYHGIAYSAVESSSDQ